MSKPVFIAGLVSFVNSLSLTIVIPVVYAYANSFGLSDFEASLLLTIFTLFQFLASPILGRLSDKYGRKPLLTLSLLGTAGASLMTAFAPSALFLYVARALDGITGGNNSIAQAIIIDSTEKSQRSKGLAVFGAAFGLGFVVGPLISTLLSRYSLSLPYIAAAVCALIATAITQFVLPETLKVRETKPLRWRELGFASLTVGLKLPGTNLLLIATFLLFATFGVFQFAVQPYVLHVLDKTTQHIGILLTLVGLMSLSGVALIHKFEKWFSLTTLLFMVIGVWIITFSFMTAVASFTYFVIWNAILGFNNSFLRPTLGTLVANSVRDEDQGFAAGLNESFGSLGGAVGPVLGGLLMSVVGTYSLVFPLAAILPFSVLILLLANRRKLNHPPLDL